jgi:phage recombination protein Bet
MTALALREDQTSWDANQLAVLRSTGIDEDVSEPELNAFLHECQRRRLDPFTRQIYLLGRYDNQKRRKVYRSQTSIDGFRLIARRAADEAKESVEYEDTLWCGPDGKWVDIWLAAEAPAGCKVVVLRNGKRFPATARFSGYVQVNRDGEPMGLWRKMPDNQLAKCSEALALRKAFPEELGSLYTDDEMAQADNPQGQTVTATVVSNGSMPADETWQTPPLADEAWVVSALERAAVFPAKEDGQALWRETAKAYAERRITAEHRSQIEALISMRVQDLEAAGSADIVEGVVVSDLPPEDPWAAAIEDILSPEDAEACIANVNAGVKGKTLTRARGDQIIAAVRAREASLVAA